MLGLGVTLAACAPGPTVSTTPTPSTTPTHPATPTAGRPATLAWTPCPAGECATIAVPRSWADPSGPQLTLAVARRPATQSPRAGVLFTNPGGPGVSGTAHLATLDHRGLEAYDLVSWDPRGVGESAPVVCLDGPALDALRELDASPDTPAERDALLAGWRGFADACVARTGRDALATVSTLDTARDLDVLRERLGEPTLSYLGVSFGTAIGVAYAHLFPDKVGRLVLDSPVSLAARPEPAQVVGFERQLGEFAAWCAGQGCALGATRDAVVASVAALLTGLDAAPLPAGARRLTQSLAAEGVLAGLYARASWPGLASALASARSGDGRALLAAADVLRGRRPDGRYGPIAAALPAIACTSLPQPSLAQAEADWAAASEAAPVLGAALGPDYTCAVWPIAPQLTPAGPAPAGLPGVLVVGGRHDPATPYEWAQALVDRLPGSVLVTREGGGHGQVFAGSACVDAAVRAYLGRGELPPPGTVCP